MTDTPTPAADVMDPLDVVIPGDVERIKRSITAMSAVAEVMATLVPAAQAPTSLHVDDVLAAAVAAGQDHNTALMALWGLGKAGLAQVKQAHQIVDATPEEQEGYDPSAVVQRLHYMRAAGLKISTFRINDPVTGERSSLQFHDLWDNTVAAVMPEAVAREFVERYAEIAAPLPAGEDRVRINGASGATFYDLYRMKSQETADLIVRHHDMVLARMRIGSTTQLLRRMICRATGLSYEGEPVEQAA